MAEQTFEKAMKRLEQVVEKLESGELALEETLKVFEEGMELVKLCSRKLEEAEKKVTLLVKDSAGDHNQVPFDVEEESSEE